MDTKQPNIPDWETTSTFYLGPYTMTLQQSIFETELPKPSEPKQETPTNNGEQSQDSNMSDENFELPPGVS